MYRIIAVYVFALVVLSTSVEFKDCGSVIGKFKEVTVTGCTENDEKCSLKVGENYTLKVQFENNEDIDGELSTVAFAASSDNKEYNLLISEDSCERANSGVKCPLKKGDQMYTSEFSLKKAISGGTGSVLISMSDKKDQSIFCASFPATFQ